MPTARIVPLPVAAVQRGVFPPTGVYSVTGNAAATTKQFKLAVTPGAYALSGNFVGYKRSVMSGAYVLSGHFVGYKRSLMSGVYTLTGKAVTFGHLLAAAIGSYALSGAAAGMLRGYRILVAAGRYLLTGTSVAYPIWPENVPQYALIEGYGEVVENNIASFTPEWGPAKRRRMFSQSSSVLSFVIPMTGDQVGLFFEFYRNLLQDGTLEFKMRHPRKQTDTVFRFAEVPSAMHVEADNYRVSLSIRESN